VNEMVERTDVKWALILDKWVSQGKSKAGWCHLLWSVEQWSTLLFVTATWSLRESAIAPAEFGDSTHRATREAQNAIDDCGFTRPPSSRSANSQSMYHGAVSAWLPDTILAAMAAPRQASMTTTLAGWTRPAAGNDSGAGRLDLGATADVG
jgi:hypothetical protein